SSQAIGLAVAGPGRSQSRVGGQKANLSIRYDIGPGRGGSTCDRVFSAVLGKTTKPVCKCEAFEDWIIGYLGLSSLAWHNLGRKSTVSTQSARLICQRSLVAVQDHSACSQQERPVFATRLSLANKHSSRLIDGVPAIAGTCQRRKILVQLLAITGG